MIRTLPSESVEYVPFGIEADVDPRAGAVSIGFSDTEDAPLAWFAGIWSDLQQVALIGDFYVTAYVAKFLIGVAPLDLAEGIYQPWIKVITGLEQVVRKMEDDSIAIT